MGPIISCQNAQDAFPDLRWKVETEPLGDDNVSTTAYAVCGREKATGDITVLVALENGAKAPRHFHRPRAGWPFRESITGLAGEMHGVDPQRPEFILMAGQSIDLTDGTPHQPFVPPGGFALALYRQPAGSEQVSDST